MSGNIQSFSEKPHVLVVDDDQRIRDLVSRFLREHGFVVISANDAAHARKLVRKFEFDVLVVDVMMPGESGLDFTRYIQEETDLPVLLLTALGEAEDRISGLECGADDYLSKPFEPRELVLRLQAIIRRTARKTMKGIPFKVGRWVFDPEHEELSDGAETLNLTAAEAALIKALSSASGEVVSREKLAEECGMDSETRSIDVQVMRLRRKIEEDAKTPRYLQTVRGRGYLLRVEAV